MNQTPPGSNPQDKRTPQHNAVDPLMPPGLGSPPPTAEPIPTAMPVPPAEEQAVPVAPGPPPPTVERVPTAMPVAIQSESLTPPVLAPESQPAPVAGQPVRPILVSPSGASGAIVAAQEPDEWGEEEEYSDVLDKAQRAAPPWVVSLAVHTIILVILGFLFIPGLFDDQMHLEIIYAEKIGEQVEDDIFESPESEELEVIEPVLAEDEMEVEDPFAAPPVIEEITDPINATSEIDAPSIGMALTGREKGMKKALLAAYGGTATTEEAVVRGLEWLKRNQLKDGSWSLEGPYQSGGAQENLVAATAMALLAFQGHGSTHRSGPYKQQVAEGWDFLLKLQDDSGGFVRRNVPLHHTLYSQAQASIGICELYGMTEDSRFRGPAQKAIDYAVKYQDGEGGWRYTPGTDSDTSVTGWFVMLMQSGLMAKLEVPQKTLDRIDGYLDRCTTDGGAQYGYKPGTASKISMTAEALLARQYLGWKHNDPRLNRGVQIVLANPIRYEDQNVYYWYYATQVMHHMGGGALERMEPRDAAGPARTTDQDRRRTWQLEPRRRPVGPAWRAALHDLPEYLHAGGLLPAPADL